MLVGVWEGMGGVLVPSGRGLRGALGCASAWAEGAERMARLLWGAVAEAHRELRRVLSGSDSGRRPVPAGGAAR